MTPARARTWTTRSGVERINHEATTPPHKHTIPLISPEKESLYTGPMAHVAGA